MEEVFTTGIGELHSGKQLKTLNTFKLLWGREQGIDNCAKVNPKCSWASVIPAIYLLWSL